MNTTPTRKKSLLALVMLAVVCLSVLAGGTYAYFTVERTAYNVITMGTLEMELVEKTTGGEPWPEGGLSGMMPGMEADKVAYVKNAGTVPFYTRMQVTKRVTDAAGASLNVNLDHVVLDFNTEAWTEKDGWYYCNAAVGVGESSAPLFTTVTLVPEMGNEYQSATILVEVLAQAVQSQNNGASALEADGWPLPTTEDPTV